MAERGNNEAAARAEGKGAPALPPAAPLDARGLLLRSVLRYAPVSLAPAVLGLLSTGIYTRLFSQDEYGRYSLALAGVLLVSSLSGQWITQGATRFIPGERRPARVRMYTAAAALSAAGVAALLTAVLAVAVAVAWPRALPGWRAILPAAAAFTVASAVLPAVLGLLQARMRAGRYSAWYVADQAARFALGVTVALWVWRAAPGVLWAAAAGSALVIPWAWRDAGVPPWRWIAPRARRLAPHVRRIAAYGTPMMGWAAASTVLSLGDRYLIGLLRGPAEVGIYAASYTLVSGSVGLLASPVLLAAHPLLMRAWGEADAADTARWLGRIVEWFVVGGMVLVAGVTLYAHDVAALILGPEFREGYRVMPWVLAGVGLWQLGMYTQKPLEFAHRTPTMLWLCIATGVLNTVLNLLLIPRLGYMAAAYTTFGSYLFYAVAAGVLGSRYLRWPLRWGRLLAGGAALAAGVFVAQLARAAVEPRAGLVAGILVSALVFALPVAWTAAPVLRPLLAARRGA